jgi:hypothetical protein
MRRIPGVSVAVVGLHPSLSSYVQFAGTCKNARFSFDALPDALDHLDRGPFGKVVVEVN